MDTPIVFITNHVVFVNHVTQLLIARNIEFTFWTAETTYGQYHISVRPDTAIELIRKAGEEWAVSLYEEHV